MAGGLFSTRARPTDGRARVVFPLAAALWPLLPVLYLQGRGVRARVPRLPGADGACAGEVSGDGAPIRLLVLGESTAAGVGVERHADGLAGGVADALARRTGRPVHWRAQGRIGATARETRETLLPEVAGRFDAVVIALGVNDVLRLHGPRRWRRELGALVDAVRASAGAAAVVLAAVPPMHRFPSLPQPLRAVLGARADRLDRAAARLAAERPGTGYAPRGEVPEPEAAALFCRDGFHPSAAGYARWGAELAPVLAELLR